MVGPQLHDLALRHQSGWNEADTRTADAVRRLTDPSGPGDDLLESVAELSRRRAHGQPDGPRWVRARRLCAPSWGYGRVSTAS